MIYSVGYFALGGKAAFDHKPQRKIIREVSIMSDFVHKPEGRRADYLPSEPRPRCNKAKPV
jgi:hypothetical protein